MAIREGIEALVVGGLLGGGRVGLDGGRGRLMEEDGGGMAGEGGVGREEGGESLGLFGGGEGRGRGGKLPPQGEVVGQPDCRGEEEGYLGRRKELRMRKEGGHLGGREELRIREHNKNPTSTGDY